MRSLQSSRIAQKNSLHGVQAEMWLVELYRSATEVLRYVAPSEVDVVWNGLTWTKKGMVVEPPRADIACSQQDMTVTVSDAGHTDLDRLAAGEFLDHKATIYLVNSANLTDASDYVKYRGLIIEANVVEALATLVIGLYPFSFMAIPRCTMDRDRCSNDFKDLRCAYAGADLTCAKTLSACVDKSNEDRYRGFPGMLKLRP